MQISRIDILRDGGTIIIQISDDPKAGTYKFPTPLFGELRCLYWNGKPLVLGSLEETEFLGKLKLWWDTELTDVIRDALSVFDKQIMTRSLPSQTYPFLYVRTVIEYLEKRH